MGAICTVFRSFPSIRGSASRFYQGDSNRTNLTGLSARNQIFAKFDNTGIRLFIDCTFRVNYAWKCVDAAAHFCVLTVA